MPIFKIDVGGLSESDTALRKFAAGDPRHPPILGNYSAVKRWPMKAQSRWPLRRSAPAGCGVH